MVYGTYLKDKSTEEYFDTKEQFEATVSCKVYEGRIIEVNIYISLLILVLLPQKNLLEQQSPCP